MKKLIIFTLFILCYSKTILGSDTLLINTKQPNKHRILLYEGQYYIKLVLSYYLNDTTLYDLNIAGGTYKIENKAIIFEDPAPMTDSIKTKYYVWPPRRIGPDYTFDVEEMVYKIFGFKVKVGGMRSIDWVVGTGRILDDNTLKLGKLEYKIISK